MADIFASGRGQWGGGLDAMAAGDASLRDASALPAGLRAQADAFIRKDFVDAVLQFATIPTLSFRENAAVPIAEAAEPAAVRAMESAWEEAWGRPLAASA